MVTQLARELGPTSSEPGAGPIGRRSARLVRSGGRLVSIVGPADGQLTEIVQRVRDGRLRTNIGIVAPLDEAVAAFNPAARRSGETIVRIRP